jgi:hypothetical protein
MILDFKVPNEGSYPIHISDRNMIDIHTTLAVETNTDIVGSSIGGKINNHTFSIFRLPTQGLAKYHNFLNLAS